MVLDLIQIFKGYVINYASFNLSFNHNYHSFTLRELNYFYDLGLSLGYAVFSEDSCDGDCRNMDLSWYGGWENKKQEWTKLILHLERENDTSKDEETLEKLFDQDREYKPSRMIGILHCRDLERIHHLNQKASKSIKEGKALIIYWVDEKIENNYEIHSYLITKNQISQPVIALLKEITETDNLFIVLKDELIVE